MAVKFSTPQAEMEFRELTWFREILSMIHAVCLGIVCILLVIMIIRELDMERGVRSDSYLLSFSKAQIFSFHMTILIRVLLYGAVLTVLLSMVLLVLQNAASGISVWGVYVILSRPPAILYPLGAAV